MLCIQPYDVIKYFPYVISRYNLLHREIFYKYNIYIGLDPNTLEHIKGVFFTEPKKIIHSKNTLDVYHRKSINF